MQHLQRQHARIFLDRCIAAILHSASAAAVAEVEAVGSRLLNADGQHCREYNAW